MTLESQLRQPRSVCVSHEKNGLSGGVSLLICCAFDVLLLTTEQPRIPVTAKPRIAHPHSERVFLCSVMILMHFLAFRGRCLEVFCDLRTLSGGEGVCLHSPGEPPIFLESRCAYATAGSKLLVLGARGARLGCGRKSMQPQNPSELLRPELWMAERRTEDRTF